jgi:hypothetical protein
MRWSVLEPKKRLKRPDGGLGCGGRCLLFLENIELERTIPQNIMIVMITAGK